MCMPRKAIARDPHLYPTCRICASALIREQSHICGTLHKAPLWRNVPQIANKMRELQRKALHSPLASHLPERTFSHPARSCSPGQHLCGEIAAWCIQPVYTKNRCYMQTSGALRPILESKALASRRGQVGPTADVRACSRWTHDIL